MEFITTQQRASFARTVKYEIDNPIELIITLNRTGNKVQVNNELIVFNNFRELEKFILDRKTTIHTLSFFSNLNTTNYNNVFTNFRGHNSRIMYLLQQMQTLTNQISQETNPHIRNLLIINYDMLEKQFNQIKSSFERNKLDIWVCRHMAFAYIYDLFGLNFHKANSFFCSDDLKYIRSHIDFEINKMMLSQKRIVTQLFAENLTINHLIECKHYLNRNSIFFLDDCIDDVLNNIKDHSIDTKLSDIGLNFKDLFETSLLYEGKTDSEVTQINHAVTLIFYFCRSLLPMCNHSFHTDMLKYDTSYHSINSLNLYLQQQCRQLYYNSPINYQEKYILTTKNHMMAFKIVHQVDAVEILFFDINCGLREKVLRITHGEYHREINILNFIDKKSLTEYGILECDDYDLSTMVCYRVNNFDGNL